MARTAWLGPDGTKSPANWRVITATVDIEIRLRTATRKDWGILDGKVHAETAFKPACR
jgi:hypothetical protein